MNRKIELLIIMFLFIVFGLQVAFGPWTKCPVYDEPHYLAVGYYNLKTGDFSFAPNNPPFLRMLSASFLLPLKLKLPPLPPENLKDNAGELFAYGKKFLYENTTSADKILFLGRIPIFILALLLGFFVFKFSSRLYGVKAGLLTLFLYSFSADIISHSGIATTDFGVTVFIFLSVYFFWKFSKKQTWLNALLVGFCFGLAQVSKVSSIVLVPVFMLLAGFEYNKLNKKWWRLISSVIIACCVILLSYRVTGIGSYFKGISIVFSSIIVKTKEAGNPNFLMGSYSSGGWWYYFIIAFLIKTPVPFIILLFWSLIKISHKHMKCLWNNDEIFVFLPAFIFFVSASKSQTQLGLRYILPVYPFLFVLAGSVVNVFNAVNANSKIVKKMAVLFLCLWYLYSAVRIFPHHLAYFNEFIGGPKNGWKYVVESNLDWGQDLKGLKKYIDKVKPANLVECYFGQGDSMYYGLKGQHILTPVCSPEVDYVNKKGQNLLAVSATYLQGLYLGDIHAFDWLKKYEPVDKIGYSIFVYDMTNNADIHFNLGRMFPRVNNTDAAIKEFKEALRLNPNYTDVHYELAILYWQKSDWKKVIVELQTVIKNNPNNSEAKKYLEIAKGKLIK
ncbi:MAG: glycosyltransferase family 39 protein [Elusimicrobia bacterium]|nr:glycosyltransferase family 39 protein [Elusimicrobiota bacterium]